MVSWVDYRRKDSKRNTKEKAREAGGRSDGISHPQSALRASADKGAGVVPPAMKTGLPTESAVQ